MTSVTAWNSLDGLPKQFISSLRVLFDILDENRCGFVRLQDIEERWHEEGVKGLPSGVIDALKKVTPPNGYLSFDRFVAGLKLSLLTSKNGQSSQIMEKENRGPKLPPKTESGRAGNSKHQNVGNQQENKSSQVGNVQSSRSQILSTAAVKPNNVLNTIHSRTNVMPRNKTEDKYEGRVVPPPRPEKPMSPTKYQDGQQAPPRPEKPLSPGKYQDGHVPPKVPPRDKSKSIISELKSWQRRVNHPQPSQSNRGGLHAVSSDSKLIDRKSHSGNDIYVNIGEVRAASAELGPTSATTTTQPQKKTSVQRRNSGRRHTLANGVDYNMIKRMKQLEEEKNILLTGLDIVDKARDWYHKQVVHVEEKQKYVGKTSYNDSNLESYQERMNFQKARVNEVNQQLKTLMESTEKGFPLHMNLAMRSSTTTDESTVKMLKDQNRQLTQEISQKSDKIAQLEQEKSSLIRDLFDARAKNKNYDDTTFM